MNVAMRPRTKAERKHPYRVNRRIVRLLEVALAEAAIAIDGQERKVGEPWAGQERVAILLRSALREIRRPVDGKTT